MPALAYTPASAIRPRFFLAPQAQYAILLSMIASAIALLCAPVCAVSHAEPATAAAIPVQENPALYAAFHEHAKNIHRRLLPMDKLYIFEGPGFTRETAWVVDGAELSQAPAAVVRLLFFIYADEERFPVVEFNHDRLEIDGKTYL